jgi:hypothetical protein
MLTFPNGSYGVAAPFLKQQAVLMVLHLLGILMGVCYSDKKNLNEVVMAMKSVSE